MFEAGKFHGIRAMGSEALDLLRIEAGFPIASADDFEAVRAISKAVRRPAVAGLARCVPADIDRAAEVFPGVVAKVRKLAGVLGRA